MADIIMTRPQYDALLAYAIAGNPEAAAIMQSIVDAANGVVRYKLNIRWQDIGGVAPPTIELGKGWPPELTFALELERPIARSDVDDVLQTQASNPVDVMVTLDVSGVVGWTLIDDFDFNAAAG